MNPFDSGTGLQFWIQNHRNLLTLKKTAAPSYRETLGLGFEKDFEKPQFNNENMLARLVKALGTRSKIDITNVLGSNPISELII